LARSARVDNHAAPNCEAICQPAFEGMDRDDLMVIQEACRANSARLSMLLVEDTDLASFDVYLPEPGISAYSGLVATIEYKIPAIRREVHVIIEVLIQRSAGQLSFVNRFAISHMSSTLCIEWPICDCQK